MPQMEDIVIASPAPVKVHPACRLCGAPAMVTLSVKPGKATWSIGDPLCDPCADHIAGIMRIPVRREPIA